jgi:hypothetical protein
MQSWYKMVMLSGQQATRQSGQRAVRCFLAAQQAVVLHVGHATSLAFSVMRQSDAWCPHPSLPSWLQPGPHSTAQLLHHAHAAAWPTLPAGLMLSMQPAAQQAASDNHTDTTGSDTTTRHHHEESLSARCIHSTHLKQRDQATSAASKALAGIRKAHTVCPDVQTLPQQGLLAHSCTAQSSQGEHTLRHTWTDTHQFPRCPHQSITSVSPCQAAYQLDPAPSPPSLHPCHAMVNASTPIPNTPSTNHLHSWCTCSAAGAAGTPSASPSPSPAPTPAAPPGCSCCCICCSRAISSCAMANAAASSGL